MSPKGKIWDSVTAGEKLGRACSFHPHPMKQSKTQQWSQWACVSRALSGVLIVTSQVPIGKHFPHFLVVGHKANNVLQNSEHPRRQRGRKHEKEKLPQEAFQSTDLQCLTPKVLFTECQSRLFHQQPPRSISL